MHSICFRVFGKDVYWFGIMLAMGFLAALASWTVLGRKEKRDFNYCSDMLFWVMISGIVGARIAYVISEWSTFVQDPITMLYVHRGGLIYYGGLIGAGVGVALFAARHHEKLLSLVDFVITSVPLGHVFGRIGCFLNGCCYGREHHGLFSVAYPKGSQPWDNQVYAGLITNDQPVSLPVYPVQLYESAFNLVLYFILIWVYRNRNRNVDGRILALYLMTYPVERFLLEFLRGDDRMAAKFMGLDVAQAVSLGLFLLGLGLWVTLRDRNALLTSQVGGV